MNACLFPVAVLACSLLLGGCAGPVATDLSVFKPEMTRIVPDDPVPVFRKVFPPGALSVSKDPLETTAEYKDRLAALGAAGTYVFVVPPAECDIQPYPDNNIYFVLSHDWYFDRYPGAINSTLPYGITLATVDESDHTYETKNKYGARVEVTSHRGLKYKILLRNLLQLPRELRWSADGDSLVHFGLAVRTADPGFRQLLREKKIGLALRVRVDDLTEATIKTDSHDDVVTQARVDFTGCYLPATLLEAWVIDTANNMSIVHWAPGPVASK